jgi:archaellum component FlaC|tara:strand:+ start:69 stop:335 length:267 start_codon:yes stop_codon:yes gene_type:complete
MEDQIKNLKDYIGERFENHEQLEALRFQRIDELITQFGKEIDSNEGTIKRVHSRVDRIEASIKTVKSVGVAISGAVATVGAWFGITNK